MKIDGQKLSDSMADKGIFAKDLCKRVKLNEAELKKILSDDGDIDMKTISRIAYVLNVSIQDLEL